MKIDVVFKTAEEKLYNATNLTDLDDTYQKVSRSVELFRDRSRRVQIAYARMVMKLLLDKK